MVEIVPIDDAADPETGVEVAKAAIAGGFDAGRATAVLNQVDGYEGWSGSVTPRATVSPLTVVVLDVRGKGTFRIDATWASAVGYEGE